jgi:hypothetical protein
MWPLAGMVGLMLRAGQHRPPLDVADSVRNEAPDLTRQRFPPNEETQCWYSRGAALARVECNVYRHDWKEYYA